MADATRDPIYPPARPAVGTATFDAASRMKRVSWGGIFAGTVIAMGLMVFFTTLGLGIGAVAIDPLYDTNPMAGIAVGSAIYLIVTQLISLFVGGSVAGRLAGVPRSVSAMIHGAAVWAVTTLALSYAAVTGAGAVFGAASSIIGNSAQAAISAGQAVIPDDLSLPSPSEIAAGASIEDLPQEVQSALRRQGLTVENVRTETQEALRNVVSRQEQRAAVDAVQQTAVDAIRTPGDIPADVNQLIDRLFGGSGAVLSDEDRQEALTTLENRLGITPAEAEEYLTGLEAQAQETAQQVQQSVEAARQQAIETAQAVTEAVRTAAFMFALASILGLGAAAIGGRVGKPDDMVGDRLGDHA